jgi:hypothetical protein
MDRGQVDDAGRNLDLAISVASSLKEYLVTIRTFLTSSSLVETICDLLDPIFALFPEDSGGG